MSLKNSQFALLFLLIVQISFSQNEKVISGRLFAKESVPIGVKIINLVSEQEAISNEKGEFKILAKENDLLVFSSNNFNYERKIIETEDFEKGAISINMVEKIEQLKEVKIVNYANINAVSLGILSQPAKEYTPAERRLRTAGDFKWYYPLLIPLGGMPLDGLINELTGRKKLLENNLKIERKYFLIETLEDDFTPSFYLENLKLKEEEIKAFQFFCAEDEQFAKTMKSKNKTLIMFKLTALAIKFKKLNEKN